MKHLLLSVTIACCSTDLLLAQKDCASECGEAIMDAQPQPPWLGGLNERSAVTGDWGGSRSALAEGGVTFTGNATQFFSGVTHGGRRTGWQYGGHNDYIFNIDMGKVAGLKGNLIKIRAEHRYGGNINSTAGAILPVNLAPGLPVSDSEKVYLTNVLITQFVSEKTGVYFGKLDTLDGDMNAFAHGRGNTQFMNASLALNPALLRAVPYSTLGVGVIHLPSPDSVINIGVLNATDTASTSGFDELFANGAVITAEGRFTTNLFGKPGHQLMGGAWSSREFNSLQQDPRMVLPPAGIPIARQSGAWGIYYNFDQYLFMNPCDPSKGWGIFGRFGITDGNPSPVDWFLSFGLGGDSPISGREADTWGLGWYQNVISDELGAVASAFLGASDGEGVELFYNYEVTPWFHLTSDVQYINPSASNRANDAVVVGFRARIDL